MKKKTEIKKETTEEPRKKRKRTSPFRMLVGAVILALMGVMSYSIYKEVVVTLNLQKDIAELNGELSTLNDQKNNLERQAENLNDPSYVEQYARGKYKLTKEGETIYKLPGKTTTEPEEGNEP